MPNVIQIPCKQGGSDITNPLGAVFDDSLLPTTALRIGAQYTTSSLVQLDSDKVADYVNNPNTRSLANMFADCYHLKDIDFTKWSVDTIENMMNFMSSCYDATVHNIDNIDVHKVALFTECFSRAFTNNSRTKSLDLSNWNMLNATDVRNMFQNSGLVHLNLSWQNFTKATYLQNMFASCSKLEDLDLSGWSTSNATNMSGFVYNCKVLRKMWVPKTFDCSKITNPSNKPFFTSGVPILHIYTDATQEEVEGALAWGSITSTITIHYESTHEEYEEA